MSGAPIREDGERPGSPGAGPQLAGALRAGIYQAGRSDSASGWKLAGVGGELHACIAWKCRGVDHYGDAAGRGLPRGTRKDLVQQGYVCGVWPTRRVRLLNEANTGGDALNAEPALQPGRLAQLADADIDIAIGRFDHRPSRQPRMGLLAGRVTARRQRDHGNRRTKPGRSADTSASWKPSDSPSRSRPPHNQHQKTNLAPLPLRQVLPPAQLGSVISG